MFLNLSNEHSYSSIAINQDININAKFTEFEFVHSSKFNIIVKAKRNGGNIKLIDFGLSDTDNYAIYKQPAGTKGYISPEQEKACITDIRNDIYSLGCIMEEMKLI